jgi:predicted dehydrogenase
MHMQLNLGLIGAGGIGRHLAWQLRPLSEARLAGVYDVDLALAQHAADELETAAYESLDALLDAPEIEAYILATPPHTHYELGMQVLQRGKHLFCEKPLALTVATLRRDARRRAPSGRATGGRACAAPVPAVLAVEAVVAGRRDWRT